MNAELFIALIPSSRVKLRSLPCVKALDSITFTLPGIVSSVTAAPQNALEPIFSTVFGIVKSDNNLLSLNAEPPISFTPSGITNFSILLNVNDPFGIISKLFDSSSVSKSLFAANTPMPNSSILSGNSKFTMLLFLKAIIPMDFIVSGNVKDFIPYSPKLSKLNALSPMLSIVSPSTVFSGIIISLSVANFPSPDSENPVRVVPSNVKCLEAQSSITASSST